MLRYEGVPINEIRERLGLHASSIARICSRYKAQGLEGFARNKYTSQKRRVRKMYTFEKQSKADRIIISEIIPKSIMGIQQLGYPRWENMKEMEEEYRYYPDSDFEQSVYIIKRNGVSVGVCGFFLDGSYAAWGPFVTGQYSKNVLRETIAFFISHLKRSFKIYVARENKAYPMVLNEFNCRIKSSQIVMSIEWTKIESCDTGININEINASMLGKADDLKIQFAEVLRESFRLNDDGIELLEELIRDNCTFLYVKQNDRVVGLLVWSDVNDKEVGLEYLGVKNNYRNLSIGTNMIKRLFNIVRERHKGKMITITQDANNAVAHGLYTKYGFVDDVFYDEYEVML